MREISQNDERSNNEMRHEINLCKYRYKDSVNKKTSSAGGKSLTHE